MVDVSQKHEYLAIKNVLSMGHCAPTVARTLLQSESIEDLRLIKLMAAMPGGIGNSGAECGGSRLPSCISVFDSATTAPKRTRFA
jgi:hypothetical protein